MRKRSYTDEEAADLYKDQYDMFDPDLRQKLFAETLGVRGNDPETFYDRTLKQFRDMIKAGLVSRSGNFDFKFANAITRFVDKYKPESVYFNFGIIPEGWFFELIGFGFVFHDRTLYDERRDVLHNELSDLEFKHPELILYEDRRSGRTLYQFTVK